MDPTDKTKCFVCFCCCFVFVGTHPTPHWGQREVDWVGFDLINACMPPSRGSAPISIHKTECFGIFWEPLPSFSFSFFNSQIFTNFFIQFTLSIEENGISLCRFNLEYILEGSVLPPERVTVVDGGHSERRHEL